MRSNRRISNAVIERKPVKVEKGLIPYRGGKSRVRERIASAIWRTAGAVEHYVEPMVGGGAVALKVAQMWKPRTLWLNDADPRVFSIWNAVTEHHSSLQNSLQAQKPTKATWKKWKKKLVQWSDDEIPSSPEAVVELATGMIFTHALAWGATGYRAGGPLSDPESHWGPKVWEHIEEVHSILAGIDDVEVTCSDWPDVVEGLDRTTTVFFDPPYFEKDGYGQQWHREDHVQLRNALCDANFRWVLTYGDDPAIRELYAFAQSDEYAAHYARNAEPDPELLITSGNGSDGLAIGDKLFKVSWDELDFDHIRGLASSIESRGIEVPIFVTPDGEVIDGRDRLLASRLVGLGLEEIPLREVDVNSKAERVALRLLLQATHKGMDWRTKARHVRDLRTETGWSWPEIERQTGIPQTTAWRWVKKLEDKEAEDAGEEDTERPIGVTLKLSPEVAEAFERIAGEQGLTRAVEDAVSLLVDWGELPDEVRALVPDEDRGEILKEALLRYLRLADLTEVA